MKIFTSKLALALAGAGLAALLVPSPAYAGTGATYSSIKNAINTGAADTIISEIERAEKLPCGSCVALIEPLIDSKDARIRDAAAWWLAKRAVRNRVKEDMFDRLQSGDSISARNAAEVLGRFAHPDALMALEIAMHDDTLDSEARAAAATAIGSIGDYRGKAILEAALTSGSADVRQASAKALRDIRGNIDAVALVPLLGDGNDLVVHQAALTIGKLKEAAGVGDLLTVVQDDTRPDIVRKHAAWALGMIGDGSAKDVLKLVAADDNSMLVRGAARSAYNALL